MDMKIWSKCHMTKITEFGKDSTRKCSYKSQCKECEKGSRGYHKEEIALHKKYYETN